MPHDRAMPHPSLQKGNSSTAPNRLTARLKRWNSLGYVINRMLGTHSKRESIHKLYGD